MNCDCRWVEIPLGIVVILFTWWTIPYAMWIVTVAAALLIIHALTCKNCKACKTDMKPMKSAKKKK